MTPPSAGTTRTLLQSELGKPNLTMLVGPRQRPALPSPPPAARTGRRRAAAGNSVACQATTAYRGRDDSQASIRVVEADLRCAPLPRRDFIVVANPPFAVTTALCRRLLGEPAVPLAGT